MLPYIYIPFLGICFSTKFFSTNFFWWSIEFPQQNISQSETRIGDKKLSVELYVVTLFMVHGNRVENLTFFAVRTHRCPIQFSYIDVYYLFLKFNEFWIARCNHLKVLSRIFSISVSKNISRTFPCSSFSVKSFI